MADLALELRSRAREEAVDAQLALGPLPASLQQAEADLRVFTHDLLHRDHDRDYRSLAAFPHPHFSEVLFYIVRVDAKGRPYTEIIRGWMRTSTKNRGAFTSSSGKVTCAY